MRKLIAGLSVMLALWSTSIRAQIQSVEIVTFGGYRWSGGLSNLGGATELDAKDAAAFGVCLDLNITRNSVSEFYWSHFSGDWDTTRLGGSFSRDDIMVNGLWYVTKSNAPARPYFTAGFGAAIFYADNAETVGRFAWNLGAGVRRDVNERAGLRVDFRWVPTWSNTCNPFFGCYPEPDGEVFDQWELTGGLIIKLGSH